MYVSATLREYADRHRKSPILILLEEWSTMGKNRPQLKHLLLLLEKCQLFLAADYISEILKEPKLKRPNKGPGAVVDISLENIEDIIRNLDYPFSDISKNAKIIKFDQIPNQLNPVQQQKNENEPSDLIKFSQSFLTKASTQNDIDDDNIPALSIINAHVPSSSSTLEMVPAIVNSNTTSIKQEYEVSSDIPNFESLMNISHVSLDEMTQTQSSISSTN